MDCEQVREALSARIDGEEPPLPPEPVNAHVVTCAACAGWLVRAQHVTRAVRLQPVQVPDLTAAVLAAVAAGPQSAHLRAYDPRRAARQRARQPVLRIAVAVAAVAPCALALPLLFGAQVHIVREIAVFELALAVGFGFAAWRPQWARAFVPVAIVLAGGLALTSVVDVAGASISPWHETGHLAAVVQAGLLWALARTEPTRPARRLASVATSPA
jgi:predicted anti-sigma-YlaC factor YlaD